MKYMVELLDDTWRTLTELVYLGVISIGMFQAEADNFTPLVVYTPDLSIFLIGSAFTNC